MRTYPRLPGDTAPQPLKQINQEGSGLVQIFGNMSSLSRLGVLYGSQNWNMTFFDIIFDHFSNYNEKNDQDVGPSWAQPPKLLLRRSHRLSSLLWAQKGKH